MKLTKQDIGKTFFAIPTGNNECRYNLNKNKPKRIIITQMRRVNGAFKFIDGGREIKFSLSQWTAKTFVPVSDGLNRGYNIWPTMEALELSKKAEQLAHEISDFFRYNQVKNVDPQAIIDAAKALKIE